MRTKILSQKGFTYLELIVVVSIFSILSVIIAYIFIIYNQAQTKAKITQQLVGNQRFIMEVIVREVRMAELDYNSYTQPIENPKQILYLKDPDDNTLIFERTSNGCATGVTNCLRVTKGANSAIISGDKINVTNLNFYINPELNPNEISGGSYLSNEQPLVTIALELQSLENNSIVIPIQSSASSKRYVR